MLSHALVGDAISIIGRLGYPGTRRYGTTPVYRLDLATFAITPVETSGDAPGWIHHHTARLAGGGIVVSRGRVIRADGEGERGEDNAAAFVLDVATGAWSRAASA